MLHTDRHHQAAAPHAAHLGFWGEGDMCGGGDAYVYVGGGRMYVWGGGGGKL